MFYNTSSHRRLIEVRCVYPSSTLITIAEFLDLVDEFTKDASPDNEIVVDGENGLSIREVRLENEQEYDERIQAAKDHAFKVQQDADRTWRRQKARFAKARNK